MKRVETYSASSMMKAMSLEFFPLITLPCGAWSSTTLPITSITNKKVTLVYKCRLYTHIELKDTLFVFTK